MTSEASDPKAPYAVPTLTISTVYHSVSSFYSYARYTTSGQTTFLLGTFGSASLGALGVKGSPLLLMFCQITVLIRWSALVYLVCHQQRQNKQEDRCGKAYSHTELLYLGRLSRESYRIIRVLICWTGQEDQQFPFQKQ